MRNQVFKKLFSVLLALIMVAGLLPRVSNGRRVGSNGRGYHARAYGSSATDGIG